MTNYLVDKLKSKVNLMEAIQKPATLMSPIDRYWQEIYNNSLDNLTNKRFLPVIDNDKDRPDLFISDDYRKAIQYGSIKEFLDNTYVRPTQEMYWGGGFLPSIAQSTGNTIQGILNSAKLSLQSVKPTLQGLAKPLAIGMVAPTFMPLAALGTIFSATPQSGLNPLNSPITRTGLFELAAQSPITKDLFKTPKEFEVFVDNLFGIGKSVNIEQPPKALNRVWKSLLGYIPTEQDFLNMRVNATDTVRGFAMALNPETAPLFKLYTTSTFKLKQAGFNISNPTFDQFAKAYDLSIALGTTPDAILPAIQLGKGLELSPEVLFNPKEAEKLRDELITTSNELYARADFRETTREYKEGKIDWDEWAKRTLEIYDKKRKANEQGVSYNHIFDDNKEDREYKEQYEKWTKEADTSGKWDTGEEYDMEKDIKEDEGDYEFGDGIKDKSFL